MRKVTKRLNYDRLSKTKSVWNITSWVFCLSKKIYTKQFQQNFINPIRSHAFTCFQFFFIKKFATLCNEKIMPNLKGLNNQNKAFIYFINKECINIVWSSPIRYHRFAKCTKSFFFFKIERVLKLFSSILQIGKGHTWNQFTRNKLALHLIFIKKWNGIHFFLKHLESFLGVPE